MFTGACNCVGAACVGVGVGVGVGAACVGAAHACVGVGAACVGVGAACIGAAYACVGAACVGDALAIGIGGGGIGIVEGPGVLALVGGMLCMCLSTLILSLVLAFFASKSSLSSFAFRFLVGELFRFGFSCTFSC